MEFDSCSTESPVLNKSEVDLELSLEELDAILEVEVVDTVPPINTLCWVARAVYGESNPRWMQFRQWLLTEAPPWFRNLYIAYGERFARWIAPYPVVKSVIRRWMDGVIA
jgi:hypothetical protein